MKVMQLKDVKQFPSFAEHFGNFYIISVVISGDTYLQSLSSGASMPVSPDREMNIFTEEEYSKILLAKVQGVQATKDALQESPAQNFYALPSAETLGQVEKFEFTAAQVPAEDAGNDEVEVPEETAPEGNASPQTLAALLQKNKKS